MSNRVGDRRQDKANISSTTIQRTSLTIFRRSFSLFIRLSSVFANSLLEKDRIHIYKVVQERESFSCEKKRKRSSNERIFQRTTVQAVKRNSSLFVCFRFDTLLARLNRLKSSSNESFGFLRAERLSSNQQRIFVDQNKKFNSTDSFVSSCSGWLNGSRRLDFEAGLRSNRTHSKIFFTVFE